jgi:hypothetical protein
LQIGDVIILGECDKEITASYKIDDLRKEFKSMAIESVADSSEQSTLPGWKVDGR